MMREPVEPTGCPGHKRHHRCSPSQDQVQLFDGHHGHHGKRFIDLNTSLRPFDQPDFFQYLLRSRLPVQW